MTDNKPNYTDYKDNKGRFTEGNPGRPLGAKNKSPKAVLNQIKAMDQAAIQKLWDSVCMGEKWAIEFVLSKVLPASRTIEFEGLEPADIMAALTEGDISPEEGKALASVIRSLKEIDDLDEIAERLEDLERSANEK